MFFINYIEQQSAFLMPGVYRLKTCPQCGKEHRRRGPNCSVSCANRGREVTDVTRQKMSQSKFDYAETPEGIAHYQILSRRLIAISNDEDYITQEDYLIDIPTDDDLDDDKINW